MAGCPKTSLNGSLMSRFPEWGHFPSGTSLGKQPIKKRLVKRFLDSERESERERERDRYIEGERERDQTKQQLRDGNSIVNKRKKSEEGKTRERERELDLEQFKGGIQRDIAFWLCTKSFVHKKLSVCVCVRAPLSVDFPCLHFCMYQCSRTATGFQLQRRSVLWSYRFRS